MLQIDTGFFSMPIDRKLSFRDGPSLDIEINMFMMLEVRRLRYGVFTLFSNEKHLSRSAVEAGTNRRMSASLQRLGISIVKFSVCVRVTIMSHGSLDMI